MKNISTIIPNILNTNVYRAVFAYEFDLLNGQTIRLCDSSEDVEIDSKIFARANFEEINNRLEIYFDNNFSLAITKNMVGASYKKYLLDLDNLSAASISQSAILGSGKVKRYKLEDGKASLELAGLLDNFLLRDKQTYSEKCRARFCDERCGLAENSFSYNGTVSQIVSDTVFISNNINETKDFSGGVVKMISGKSAGKRFDVKIFSNKNFEMISEIISEIEVEDSFSAVVGCDKSFKTCIQKFNNAVNFRGEPKIPGNKILLGG